MILQTALAIVDRDGVDRLSIRRLSNAVGRDPVMLYRHVPNKATSSTNCRRSSSGPRKPDHVLRLGLHRLAITEFPVLRALAPALASYDGAAELDRGLDLLLPGLTATLTHPDGSPPTT